MVVKKATPVKKVAAKKVPAKRVPAAKKVAAKVEQPTEPNRSNRQTSDQIIGRVGNLGGEPEMRFTPSGTAVCSVSLAYTPYNFETKEQGETVWYRCIGFGPLAENMVANLETGMRVCAVGRPQLNKWEGDDGETHVNKEILLDGIGPDRKSVV